jgi:hypothetical protein
MNRQDYAQLFMTTFSKKLNNVLVDVLLGHLKLYSHIIIDISHENNY